MEFVQVDVFADAPYRGNPLAVFPDAGRLSAWQMQMLASEMNLSETTFVTAVRGDSYDVRIFTPEAEFGFAGHPTIGTAWTLLHLGLLRGDSVTQVSGAGDTAVTRAGDKLWFRRAGSVHEDMELRDPGAPRRVARAVALREQDVFLEARELGRPGLLRPAWADAGMPTLIVPVKDPETLCRCAPAERVSAGEDDVEAGIYCFTAVAAGHVRARCLFPRSRLPEDAATGSAAAALGLYLADRVGAMRFEIDQGVEMGRPSRISVDARPGSAAVGGRCALVLRGRIEALPSR